MNNELAEEAVPRARRTIYRATSPADGGGSRARRGGKLPYTTTFLTEVMPSRAVITSSWISSGALSTFTTR